MIRRKGPFLEKFKIQGDTLNGKEVLFAIINLMEVKMGFNACLGKTIANNDCQLFEIHHASIVLINLLSLTGTSNLNIS